jgi:glucokinase
MSARGGLDLGGTKIQAAVVDGRGRVLGEARRPTPTSGGPDAVADELTVAMREACGAAGVEVASLAGVGVGSPGEIDARAGTVAQARNLSNWIHPFPLGSVLSADLGVPVAIGNDVSVATQAEFELGAGKEFDSLLGVFWGTGVGGGVVIGGELWTGRGSAGEIGHVVVKEDGRRCPCGRRGCMEAYAGRASMEARARRLVKRGQHTELFEIMEQRGRTRLTSGVWERALERGDDMAVKIVNRAVKALGTGVASAVNLLDVEAVVIGGGLGVRLGEPYAERIAAAMHPHLFVDERPPVVRVAALGDLGGAIGASLLVPAGSRQPAVR